MQNEEAMLTTIDNPFNPFEDFINWFLFDIEKGYNSCSRLARVAKLSDSLTEKEENEEINKAIDKIIALDFTDTYKKVTRTTM